MPEPGALPGCLGPSHGCSREPVGSAHSCLCLGQVAVKLPGWDQACVGQSRDGWASRLRDIGRGGRGWAPEPWPISSPHRHSARTLGPMGGIAWTGAGAEGMASGRQQMKETHRGPLHPALPG